MSRQSLEKESHLRQNQFLKIIKAGTWRNFLRDDAEATRGSFRTWWHGTYSGSSEARALPKRVKVEIQQLLDVVPPNRIEFTSLHPETLRIFQVWESTPLVEQTVEWKKAKVRLVRDLAYSGHLKKALAEGLNPHLSAQDLGEARCWLYQADDGAVARYQSLEQPWRYKDLRWDQLRDQLVTVIAVPDINARPNPAPTHELPPNPECLRLSLLNFWKFVDGTYPPGRTQQAQLALPQYPATGYPLGHATNAHLSQVANSELEQEPLMEAVRSARSSLTNDLRPTHEPPVELLSSSPVVANNDLRPRSRGSTLSVSEDEVGPLENTINLWDIPPYAGPQGYNVNTHNGTRAQPIEIQHLPDYDSPQSPYQSVIKREDLLSDDNGGLNRESESGHGSAMPFVWNGTPLFDCDPNAEYDSDVDHAYMCMPSYGANACHHPLSPPTSGASLNQTNIAKYDAEMSSAREKYDTHDDFDVQDSIMVADSEASTDILEDSDNPHGSSSGKEMDQEDKENLTYRC